MRLITNCCGEVLKHKSLRTAFLSSASSHPKKWNNLGINVHLKTLDRKFSSKLKNPDENLNEDFFNSLTKLESLHSSNSTRNLLYPETDDEIISKVKSCYSLEDVLQIINSNESLSHQQLIQAVLVLRDLQKIRILRNILLDKEQHTHQLCNSPSFQKMLSLIASNVDKMDATEISYCLLYLNKLNVKCNEPVMMKLIDAYEKSMFKVDKDLMLQNLTRFFMAIKEENNLWSLYTMNSYLPILIESLDTCDNYDDFRHITVCFQKCVPLLNSDILKKYLSKLDFVLRDNGENDDVIARTRTILKTIVFLNFKYWNGRYINEVRQLIAAMKGKSHHLCFAEVSLLHKAAISFLEPFDLLQEIEKTTKIRIQTYQNMEPSIPIFIFQVLFPGIKLMTGDELKNYLIEYLKKSSLSSNYLRSLSDIHQLIFISDLKFDRKVTSTYWTVVVNLLKDVQQRNSDEFLENVTSFMHKYIHLIGVQKVLRNEFFERSLVSFIVYVIRNDKFIYEPAEYSKFYLTILALSHKNPFHFFTEAVRQKLLEYIPRLSIYDNLIVSLILRTADDRFKERQNDLGQFLRYYVHLNAAANANASDNLRRDSDILPDKLNSYHLCHLQTKGMKSSEIFAELCDRFQRVRVEQLHSRIIRDSIYNFTVSDHLIPEFTDMMIEYCIKEKNTLFGVIVADVLMFCYLFGYVPNKMDKFLPIAISLIERDKESIPKAKYLRSALALSYFGELPSAWCDYIFNIKFLEQLDDYLSKLKFKKTITLRKELMELNRIVCINYPYCEVPWFHEKFCQEITTTELKKPNDFLKSVLSVVKTLVKEDGAIETNCTTPYGHRIDIVLFLSNSGQAINVNDCGSTELRKIALLLRYNLPTSYHKRKGKWELFSRQLEMLNFEVISLSKQEWDSMYLSNLQEKTNHLKKLIWPVPAS